MARQHSLLLCRAAETRHGNVDRIGREILSAADELGWGATDVVIPGGDPRAALDPLKRRIEDGAFDFALSIQDMGHFSGDLANTLFARGGVRRLYWALDHPYSCWRSIAELPADSVVTYPTASNLACCRTHLRADLALRCAAHAAAPQDARSWGDRDIDILFVGNMPRPLPDALRQAWPAAYGEPWAAVLEEMAERFDPAATPSLDALAEAVLAGQSIVAGRHDVFELMRVFDGYAWARTRLDFALALTGLPVTFVGEGWSDFAKAPARALGVLETAQTRALMARARLVLNLLPAYYRSHERVFDGMAAGAAVASTGAGCLANARGLGHDPADETAVLYLRSPGEAADRLRAALADKAGLRRAAEAGWEEQRARHTWRHRLTDLFASLEAKSPASDPLLPEVGERGQSAWRNRSIMLFHANRSEEVSLERLGSGLVAGFRQRGWRAYDVDLAQGDAQKKLRSAAKLLMAGEVDLLLDILGMGDVKGDDAQMARAGVRRLCWDVNHPYSLWETTAALPANTLVCFTTASNLDCCRRFIRDDLRLHLMAHAATVVEPVPWSQRTIPALFVGNLQRPLPDAMRRNWCDQHGAEWGGVLEAMAERFDPQDATPLEKQAEQVLVARGKTGLDKRNFFILLRLFDGYARARTRFDYAQTLRGLPVTYVGRGWEGVAGDAATILGPLPSARTRALMREARVVLNILPAYYRSHERVFEGMAAGAAVLSGGGGYIANALGRENDAADGTALAYFGPPAQAGDDLGSLLADAARLRDLADEGLSEQRARHSWGHRVEALLASVGRQS